jgi:hypothetical protein
MFINRGLFIAKAAIFCAPLLFTFSYSARALIIDPTYDITVNTNANATQIKADIGIAITNIETLLTNPITLNITVYWGTNGASNPFSNGIALSESDAQLEYQPGSFGYPQVTNALWASRKTAAQISAYTNLPGSDPTPNGSTWLMPRCEAKALGLTMFAEPNDSVNDGAIGFTTDPGIVFDFNPTNRAVVGEYDFIASAEHEMTEVMGRTTYRMDVYGYYLPFDLFRFTNSGAANITAEATNAYFSVNGGATVLEDYNEPYNGGDLQDWESPSIPPDSFDAYAYDGDENYLSYADLIALNVLGYELSYKAPTQAAQPSGANSVQITFTNQTGMALGVLMTTNANTSLTNWTLLGMPTENPVGHYQFTDTHATNSLRLYDVILQ